MRHSLGCVSLMLVSEINQARPRRDLQLHRLGSTYRRLGRNRGTNRRRVLIAVNLGLGHIRRNQRSNRWTGNASNELINNQVCAHTRDVPHDGECIINPCELLGKLVVDQPCAA